MKSMTGFGRAVADCGDLSITLDVSSVNKKGLEICVSLPREWQAMERGIVQQIKKSFVRGKVNVACKADFKKKPGAFSIDSKYISEALDELRKTCEFANVKFKPTADLILRLSECLTQQNSEFPSDWENFSEAVESCVESALEKSEDMRQAEGLALKDDLSARLKTLSGMLADVENCSKGTVEKYKSILMQRLANAGLEVDLNDERVLKEICLFADKCDICEEITRLKSHISQFASTMEESDAVGRKMDFICQEMGREINTIASKANNLDLTKLAIDMKNELERVREQIQNVE